MSDSRVLSIKQASHEYSVSENLIRRAIKSLGRPDEPPYLPAKNYGGRAGYRIKAADMDAWHDAHPDA